MLSDSELIRYERDAGGLAGFFSNRYYQEHEKRFPLNPFQVLADMGIHFIFRNFKGIEGLYFPPSDDNIELVVINARRPITRQRYTAAHELCHFLKDKGAACGSIICTTKTRLGIEKYADAFAAAFLMPEDELRKQLQIATGGKVLNLEDIVMIASYFGVSFEACYYRIKDLGGYNVPSWKPGKKNRFKPNLCKDKLGLNDAGILLDLADAWNDITMTYSGDFAKRVFMNRYVYNDARIEGVNAEREAVAEIVIDLQEKTQHSRYCSEQYEPFCHIAGHSAMLSMIFEDYDITHGFGLNEIFKLNAELFSRFPFPEYGGKLRQTDTLVMGAKFDTVSCSEITDALRELETEVERLEGEHSGLPRSEVLKRIMRIHHRLTVIHPFSDGNGRTCRGFMNEMLMRYGLLPFYVNLETKDEYHAALREADISGDYSKLYEYTVKALIRAHVELSIRGDCW